MLEEIFGRDPGTFDDRPTGSSCLFAFHVSAKGQLHADTFVLSTLAWVAGRTIKPGPSSSCWLDGFQDAEISARQTLEHQLALSDTEVEVNDVIEQENSSATSAPISVLTHESLEVVTKAIVSDLGIADLIKSSDLRISSVRISKSRLEEPIDPPLLNSFFLKDLEQIASASERGHIGVGLSQYLSDDPTSQLEQRMDIRADPELLLEGVAPHRFPFGRWPSPGHHPLVVSQQFAVNTAISRLSGSAGLFAVNGPPGTGKTTLLRDLVADVVVRRAMEMANLSAAEDAFTGESSHWQSGNYRRTLWQWSDQFHGYEVVVASTNNGAVANITKELPGLDAVDQDWLAELDYFPGLANEIAGKGKSAWGLMAAQLGNRSNCNEFRTPFWFGADYSGKDSQSPPVEGDESPMSMQMKLNNYREQTVDWHAAVARFQSALNEEGRCRKACISAYKVSLEILSLQKKLVIQKQRLNELALEINRAQRRRSELAQLIENDQRNIDRIVESRVTHRRFRPGIIEILFSFGKAFRVWQERDREYASALVGTEDKRDGREELIASGVGELRDLEVSRDSASQVVESMQEHICKVEQEYCELVEVNGLRPPDADAWQDDQRRELDSPWADDSWNESRARVFVEALTLQRVFIQCNARKIQDNLRGAMEILVGSVPSGAPESGVKAAWTALFMVVPVISTTFASCARLFSQLGSEALGWLLIDEAGQSSPQDAVGAIWRCKRILVVGDPLQLEPVSTVPLSAQQALRKHFHVGEYWIPGKQSVQLLADRMSVYGTYLNTETGRTWIGSPLRVHRRCDEPMFSICNTIAYSGLMVFGTTNRPSLAVPDSAWINVDSVGAEGNWIPEEGKAVRTVLELLLQSGIKPTEIFLISPFRAVADELRRIAISYKGVMAGTIHTTQGKEATVVVCVLGTDAKRSGARLWASRTPNLLNVAVSRAKQRLYIVGNRAAWSRCNYFSDCISQLPSLSVDEFGETSVRESNPNNS